MSLKAILTTMLLVGSSSAALAAPRYEARHERFEHRDRERFERREGFERREWFEHHRPFYMRPFIREHYIYRSPRVAYVQSAFIDGRLSLSLGGGYGNAIELNANGGSTYVSQVLIEYADGGNAMVPVNQNLDAYNPIVDLPCAEAAVANIVVFGYGSGVSAYLR
jgi:hypothetical protein